jgi:hypothetical protein
LTLPSVLFSCVARSDPPRSYNVYINI